MTNEEQLLLKYDGQFPRYTSYPTAVHFNNSIDGNIYRNWLESLPEQQSLSLYFHIPFCQKLCWYCGCFTKITNHYKPVEDYTKILLKEIDLIGKILQKKNHHISNIHFGGGSPNILMVDSFKNLMQKIRDNFFIKADAEIAIEIDPRKTDEEKIKCYAKSGINRISLGVQDFDREVQIAVNREQPFELVRDSIEMLRHHGINQINIDLIYGLPKQTVNSVNKTVDLSLTLNPSRIALFGYAHVKWKKKHMRLIMEENLPNSLDRIRMYKLASEKFKQAGYVAIGIDHFAKSNDPIAKALENKTLKRNFQGYTNDKADHVIGFGASAIGYLPYGYAQNTLNFEEYDQAISSGMPAICKGIAITTEDKIRKRIIDDLMCYMTIDLNKIAKDFTISSNYFDEEISRLLPLQQDGLIDINQSVISINRDNLQITRVVAATFDKFFTENSGQHSKVV